MFCSNNIKFSTSKFPDERVLENLLNSCPMYHVNPEKGGWVAPGRILDRIVIRPWQLGTIKTDLFGMIRTANLGI